MLNRSELEQKLLNLFNTTIPVAFERAMLESFPTQSEFGQRKAKQFGATMDQQLSACWAKTIAYAIDSYIKNAQIYGNLITNGSPTTHTCQINSLKSPVLNGKIPNTLGIK